MNLWLFPQESGAGTEIKQENIKNQIKEIISDIDKEISIAEEAHPQDAVSAQPHETIRAFATSW